jgi:hypothetical protein
MSFLGVEPRNVGVVLAEGLCDLGGITSAEGLRDGEAGRAPFFSLCPGIRLTTEEKHGKPQSGQPSSHRTARCVATRLNYIKVFSPYRKENTALHHYKYQLVNAV